MTEENTVYMVTMYREGDFDVYLYRTEAAANKRARILFEEASGKRFSNWSNAQIWMDENEVNIEVTPEEVLND